ncbi:D-glycero-beta-D-manno-heptose 1-phosphate adenylyltransferase [Dietzia aurantiaca]|uniref:D-glycero-beta-D-manno-heptose 1-phosphate adenylyltransferase n=1 Tax=Dietzia aurantiaca TaxID=983873 RepID=UPI001E38ABB9|nr:D-glycero-beta-D-manno-heptose 1-phosphate adenylyltransferase [Dietzia aurantiaca]MCD2261157.1 D-glycero-beta-D-manno-heptose 1-phosphate adenylyltransferase [Dietzia aurantiaca]
MAVEPVVIIGDVILDRDLTGRSVRLCPDAPVPVVDTDTTLTSPGGAGLAALMCARIDRVPEVRLVAPLADDVHGEQIRADLTDIDVVALGHSGGTRTKTRIRSEGQTLLRVDDGGPGLPVDVDRQAVADALAVGVVLVSDYGAGTTHDEGIRTAIADKAEHGTVVWDPHPRGGAPVPGCALVTPNLAEAQAAAREFGLEVLPDRPDELAAGLRRAWRAHAVSVTVGPEGAWFADEGGCRLIPSRHQEAGDPCGAGDRYSVAAATALSRGESAATAAGRAGAAASTWVADGGAAGFRGRGNQPSPSPLDGFAHRIEQTRRSGGVIVATGGCFDILHAGHAHYLRAARELGDLLVVLLNSDDSVRRLKGPARPVMPEVDRRHLLEALACVDAVVVFDEDDPRAALEVVRPDVWVKGGDYRADTLPEAPLVHSWGGRVEILPLTPGRSTTSILRRTRDVG